MRSRRASVWSGLETFALQIGALDGLPEAAQIGLLKATVATIHLRNDALEVVHRAYLARDLGISVPFTKRIVERAGHDPSPLDDFERDIATKRNYGMRDASLPLLQQGGAFIARRRPAPVGQGRAGRTLSARPAIRSRRSSDHAHFIAESGLTKARARAFGSSCAWARPSRQADPLGIPQVPAAALASASGST